MLILEQAIRRLFLIITGLFLAGLIITLFSFDLGLRIAGLSLIALGAWLLRYDIARRTIRKRGLTRYIVACLFPGNIWLAFGGLLRLIYGGPYAAGLIYNALLHSLFVGFVFSMIFGHALIILPAITGIQIPYSPWFYLHLGLSHVSLILRIAEDLIPWPLARQWGGLNNEVAILLFLFVTMLTSRRSARLAKQARA